MTFGELDLRASKFATGISAAGLSAGDRVLLLTPNSVETFEILIGCARAGAICVPVNWRLAPDELQAVVDDCGARALIVDPGRAGSVCVPDAVLSLVLGEPYEAWLATQQSGARGRTSDDAVVLHIYTSGTSGRPKAVQITNANLAAKVPNVVPRWGLTDTSVSLLATPLFHVGALSWGLAGLAAGANTLLAGDASAKTLLGHLEHEAVTHTFLVPAMIDRLCHEAAPDATFPALRLLLFGAAPISEQSQAAAVELFGPVLRQVYGLSETTGGVCEVDASSSRSAGRPYPWVDLEIHDPLTGERVDTGRFGEVWTRSAQNTPGYAGLADETAALLTVDGWLRTGDGGHLDEDGCLFLTDRVKDLIISGGENVYPAEVEAIVGQHPDVADVAVFGVPDSVWGERVAAAVVPRLGSPLKADDVVAFTDGRIAGYKRPRAVIVLNELPRNAGGKVLRRELRTRAGKESQ